MILREFIAKAEYLQVCEDEKNGRLYNRDSFGHWVRDASRYLTFVFWKLGFRAHYVLFLHFVCDLLALFQVWQENYGQALGLWALGHFLDNCDGDLARVRGEARPEWGEIDVLLHTWANAGFWIVLGVKTEAWLIVSVVLALRVINQWHRGRFKNGERFGERSKLLKWVAYPLNVNFMYAGFAFCGMFGLIPLYLQLYLVYHLFVALSQSVRLVFQVWTVPVASAKDCSSPLKPETPAYPPAN